MKFACLFLFGAAISVALGGSTINTPESAWQTLTRADLEFIYKTIKDNHPGPIDEHNPEFNTWLDNGKLEAITDIKKADSLEAYRFILLKYIKGFNDGHLNFWTNYEKPTSMWPGFVIAYRKGEYRVYQSAVEEIKKGDQLLACDQKDVENLYASNVFPYKGLPEPESERYSLAPHLFVDQGNPFVSRPAKCQFSRDGTNFEHALSYSEKDQIELDKLLSEATFGPAREFQYQKIDEGKYWVSLPTFAPEGEQITLLKNYIKKLEKLAKTSATIVFDVRGNSGGSSSWGQMLLTSLYGKANLEKIEHSVYGNVVIDWRVSAENYKATSSVRDRIEKDLGPDDETTRWLTTFVKQFKQALEEGKPTIKQYPDKKRARKTEQLVLDAKQAFKGNVVLLTDGRCASACLDFADIVRALPNAIHVGLETSADTVYMEANTIDQLPSGLGTLYYPMKVYRNRVRGNRESYQPEHIWPGEMADTEGLQNWIFNDLEIN